MEHKFNFTPKPKPVLTAFARSAPVFDSRQIARALTAELVADKADHRPAIALFVVDSHD